MIHSLISRIKGWLFKAGTNFSFLSNRSRISWSTLIRKAGNTHIKIGKHSRIVEYGKIIMHPGSSLIIGTNTSIDRLCEIVIEENSSLSIGDNVFIGSHANIRVTGEMKIGNDCRIAQFVSLINGNYGYLDRSLLIRNQPYQKGNLYIGDDVWIGVSSVILPNIKVGNGAVIGAGAIISKSVEEYMVVVGNPQKVINSRK